MWLLKNPWGYQIWLPFLNNTLTKVEDQGPDGDDIYLIDFPLLSNPINSFEHHLASYLLVPNDLPPLHGRPLMVAGAQ